MLEDKQFSKQSFIVFQFVNINKIKVVVIYSLSASDN